MEDQAKKLKDLMRKRKKTITVASGKGGVGKTSFAVNLSIELGKLGEKTLLIDGDLSLANADLLLGIIPQKHIGHILEGNASLKSVIQKIDENLDFIPSSSGIVKLTQLTEAQMKKIRDLISKSEHSMVVLDAPAGIGRNVISLSLISDAIVVILTPDPASITDAYALIKVVSKSGFQGKTMVVTNMVSNSKEREIAFVTLKSVAEKYLGISPILLGEIPWDESVKQAFRLQKPFVSSFPKSKASESIRKIAKQIINVL